MHGVAGPAQHMSFPSQIALPPYDGGDVAGATTDRLYRGAGSKNAFAPSEARPQGPSTKRPVRHPIDAHKRRRHTAGCTATLAAMFFCPSAHRRSGLSFCFRAGDGRTHRRSNFAPVSFGLSNQGVDRRFVAAQVTPRSARTTTTPNSNPHRPLRLLADSRS